MREFERKRQLYFVGTPLRNALAEMFRSAPLGTIPATLAGGRGLKGAGPTGSQEVTDPARGAFRGP